LKSYAKADCIAQEVFTSIHTVHAFNGSKKEYNRYVKNLDNAKFYGIKKGFLNGLLTGFLWLSIFSAYTLGFWYGWHLSVPDPVTGSAQYSIGRIVLVFFSVLIGVQSFGKAVSFMGILRTARVVAHVIFMIIDQKPSINSFLKDQGKTLKNMIGNICFENVSFNYPSRSDVPVLKNLNFTLNAGLKYALVGSSGSGKSTCVQLLQRFYDPIQGDIRIDDINIKEININWLRNNIGVVNQVYIIH
jgi:ATP-binding cassette, subfamily B (MDR/TAP), member 1